MSAKNHQELYCKIKKRISDYKYRSLMAKGSVLLFVLLLVLSLFPLIPVLILILIFGNSTFPSNMIGFAWFGSIGLFGTLFLISQRVSKNIARKRGLNLEEQLYVQTYETLSLLNEYLDIEHPIQSSKRKAIRKLETMAYTLGQLSFPDSVIVKDETNNILNLGANIVFKLIPKIEKTSAEDLRKENISKLLESMIDYLSEPRLTSLISLNQSFLTLPIVPSKSKINQLKVAIVKPSYGRHILAFCIMALITIMVTYVGVSFIGVNLQEGYIFGVGSMIGLVAIYFTYLGLTTQRKT